MTERKIYSSTLRSLFGESLTSSLCVNVEKDSKMWVVTGMLVQYLESFTDSIVVRENNKPIGIIGGRDIIESISEEPSPEFFEKNVQEVMESRVPEVSGKNTYEELMDFWNKTRRAFAIIKNEFGDYSSLSAKKILELGKNCKTDLRISNIPKKNIVSFSLDDSVGNVMELMLKNKTRRLLLKDTNKFINDRAIIEKISEELNYLRNTQNFADIPIKEFNIVETKTSEKDLLIPEISKIMYELEHPYVIYRDNVITPWDICQILLSDNITIDN